MATRRRPITKPSSEPRRPLGHKNITKHWFWRTLVVLNVVLLVPTILFFLWLAYQNNHTSGEPQVVAPILWPFFFIALLTFIADAPALGIYSYQNYQLYQKTGSLKARKKALISLIVLVVMLLYIFVGGVAR